MGRIKIFAALAIVAVIAAVAFYPRIKGRAAPSAPPPASHSVQLNWTPVPAVTSYNVYRSRARDTGFWKIGSTQAASYSDSPDSGPGTFFYAVTAVNDKGESGYSERVEVSFP